MPVLLEPNDFEPWLRDTGSELMNWAVIVCPTLVPKAAIGCPLGPVLPAQVPTTMFGL